MKISPVFIEIFVKSLIWITTDKKHEVVLNRPKYIVGFTHLSGLGDPYNENNFSN